ncbi:MAG: hypothetical protein IPK39_24295 [Sulfuritalea sp.]|nr:hypothetical protein [Sulfuritalea sp.]
MPGLVQGYCAGNVKRPCPDAVDQGQIKLDDLFDKDYVPISEYQSPKISIPRFRAKA